MKKNLLLASAVIALIVGLVSQLGSLRGAEGSPPSPTISDGLRSASEGMGQPQAVAGGLGETQEGPRSALPGAHPKAEAAKPFSSGLIKGQVLSDLESPVGGCNVLIHLLDRKGNVAFPVDAGGNFHIPVNAGIYELSVEQDSLPEGFVAPFERAVNRVGVQGRYERQLVEISPENPNAEVTLHVFKSALVYGRVVDEKGEPIEGAFVFASYAGLEFVPGQSRGEGETDADGEFEVRIAVAGNYRLNVQCGPEDPLFRVAPPTLELTIESGGVYPVGTLQSGGSDITLEGHVINQGGEPFVGAPVICFPSIPQREGWRMAYNENVYGRTTTDSSGRFTLSDLPKAPIQISTFADWEKPLGERRAATWWTKIELDLSDQPPSSTLDIGEYMTPESRPFNLTVHYQPDEDWYEEHGLRTEPYGHPFGAHLEPVTPFPDTTGMTHQEKFLAVGGRTEPVDTDDPLTDRWISDAKPGPYVLIISSRDELFDTVEYPVEFTPNGSRELTIPIPPK